jgi:sarcosine oxidase subunit beta
MPAQTHDVVVVGGGIIGLACAYYLAKAGANTLLIERGLPGAEQTVRTGGGIRLCHSSVINIQLSKLSFPTWERFEEHFGFDLQFKRIGHLFLARSEASAQVLQDQTHIHQQLDIPSVFLDLSDINHRWQDLRLKGYEGGLFCTVGGYLNHHRAVQGFYHGAMEAGARLLIGVRVTGLVRSGQRILGVETTEDTYHAEEVVNCAGALAGQIASMADLDLPIVSRRHELLIVQPERPIADSLPWLIDVERQVHLRPDGQGRGLLGGFLGDDPVVDPERYDPLYDEIWASRVRVAASQAFGLFEPSATILQGWAGVYAGTPDYHPVIERSCPGLLTAAGFSGTGLMHAPAVGMLVCELTRSDAANSLDISTLRSSRLRDQGEPQDGSGF